MKNKSMVIISSLLFAIWFVAMFSFDRLFIFLPGFMLSIFFGIVAFAGNLCYFLVLAKDRSSRNEISHIPMIFANGYLVIALIANFFFSYYMIKLGFILFFNILCLCITIGAIFFSENYIGNTEKKIEKIEKKQYMHKIFSLKIGKTVALAKDEEIRKKLLGLKELCDYSNAFSGSMTEELDAILSQKLDTLQGMLLQDGDKDKILERIDDIIADIKTRNAVKSF